MPHPWWGEAFLSRLGVDNTENEMDLGSVLQSQRRTLWAIL